MKRIWGIEYEELFDGQFLIWRATFNNPFFVNSWKIGLNEKFLRLAIRAGVNKFVLLVGQKDIMMNVPNYQELRRKDKNGEFEIKQSMFKDSPAMKIYHFKI